MAVVVTSKKKRRKVPRRGNPIREVVKKQIRRRVNRATRKTVVRQIHKFVTGQPVKFVLETDSPAWELPDTPEANPYREMT